ncbi:MAG: hypothetical protein ACJA16_002707 [Akkermansiaceae bacterium]|jgi:hypothetical protein
MHRENGLDIFAFEPKSVIWGSHRPSVLAKLEIAMDQASSP